MVNSGDNRKSSGASLFRRVFPGAAKQETPPITKPQLPLVDTESSFNHNSLDTIDFMDCSRRSAASLSNRGDWQLDLSARSSSSSSPSKQRKRKSRYYPSPTFLVKVICVGSVTMLAVSQILSFDAAAATTTSQHGIVSNDASILPPSRKVTASTAKTLALLHPPGLLGGYRNQVLRFIAFVVHAKQNRMNQLLLPSLLWSTQLGGIGLQTEWFRVPFSWIFDVDHWNSFAEHLPVLVERVEDSDCWMQASEMHDYNQLREGARILHNSSGGSNKTHWYSFSIPPLGDSNHASAIQINHLQRATLLQGTLRALSNVTVPFIAKQITINARKRDFLPMVQDCKRPYVYGGGTKGGRLWNDYVNFSKKAAGKNPSTNITGSVVPFETDVWVYRALRPAEPWRRVAEQCVTRHTTTGRYIALHARVELEMMGHVCGRHMEKNFTTIIERVYALHNTLLLQQEHENTAAAALSGVFVAVSRAGMEVNHTHGYKKFKQFADENLRTLNRLTLGGDHQRNGTLFGGSERRNEPLSVFECGERILDDHYADRPDVPDHGSLLQAVVNFHIAVSADVFVGVKSSSYSTDILTTRYWLGKGETNYRYTKDGIEKVENGGLPEPHSNCNGK